MSDNIVIKYQSYIINKGLILTELKLRWPLRESILFRVQVFLLTFSSKPAFTTMRFMVGFC